MLACRFERFLSRPLSMLFRAMPPQLRGRDLDGERNAIEIGANPFDDREFIRVFG